MNVFLMMDEVVGVANLMVRESALPNFRFSPGTSAKRVRVSALDELDGAFNGYIERRSEKQMNVIGHQFESGQKIMPFASIDYGISHRRRIWHRQAFTSSAGIVIACIVGIAVVVGIFAFTGRAKPQGAGAINFVTAVDVPGQDIVMAAITFTLRNTTQRPLWVHTLKAQFTTPDGKTEEDEAASVVDLERYFQAFPALKESAEPPLAPETKMLPGAEQRGTIIVSFKVSKEAFNQRKSLTVSIQPYDQPLPVILK